MALFRKLAAAAALALTTLTAGLTAGLPARAAELVMVEESGCVWCARWEAELGAIYPKTPEGQLAPLRKVEIVETRDDTSGIAFARPVLFTPTFVLVEDGRELARIEGYPGEDFFWGLLGGILADHLGFDPVQG
ncbi:thioredoxin family protein [Aliiroseovarius sp.]|uniref:thioredoxin family protein n=1 Tax=Aliiroseovarius sp. TaxID=1872442 RepID=UPI002628F614|nr:thioredoxin family protein [Aliiroseovarius sp.]